MKLCDLHTHSIYSDGTYTPAQLLDAAEAQNLSALVLSDHNTADGLPDFLENAKASFIDTPGKAVSILSHIYAFSYHAMSIE